jgi:hypothetical protein
VLKVLGTIRVSIDIGSGKLEVEGDNVEEVLDRLRSLPGAIPEISAKISRVRLAIPKPTTPKGVKLAYEILRLKDKDWFEEPKDVLQVIKKLDEMGVPATRRQVSSALAWLARKGRLKKEKEENRLVYSLPPSVVKF